MLGTGLNFISDLSSEIRERDLSTKSSDQPKKEEFESSLKKEISKSEKPKIESEKPVLTEEKVDTLLVENLEDPVQAELALPVEAQQVLEKIQDLLNLDNEQMAELQKFLNEPQASPEKLLAQLDLNSSQKVKLSAFMQQVSEVMGEGALAGLKGVDQQINKLVEAMDAPDQSIDIKSVNLNTKLNNDSNEGSMSDSSNSGSESNSFESGLAESLGKIGKTSSNTETAFKVEMAEQNTALKENMPQIIEKARFIAQKGGGNMKLQMNHQELGLIDMKVSVKDGLVNVELLTQNKEMKLALENGLADLKAGLQSQDVDVRAIKVDVDQNLSTDLRDGDQNLDQQMAREFLQDFRDQNPNWKKDLITQEALNEVQTGSTAHYGMMKSRPMRSSGLLNLVA